MLLENMKRRTNSKRHYKAKSRKAPKREFPAMPKYARTIITDNYNLHIIASKKKGGNWQSIE